MAVSLVLGLWFSRDTTFTLDELYLFSASPQLDLRGLIEPYNGHLVLTTRLVYAATLDVFGAGYLPFRLLTLCSVLLTAGLLFVFAQRRIGAVAALAPTLVLLFYGSDPYHVISGNGFTVLLPLALGIAALLALEREDLGGDLGACVLLCLAIATYSVGVAFVVGTAALILLGADRWRRAWVFLVPALLYGAWFLWSRSQDAGTGEGTVSLGNLLLVPNWMLNSLAAVGTSLLGLNYDYGELGSNWGPVVAIAALVALAWRLRLGNVPTWLWALMAVPATLWVIGAARGVFPPFRVPQSSRYIFPGPSQCCWSPSRRREGRSSDARRRPPPLCGRGDQLGHEHRPASGLLGTIPIRGRRDANGPGRGRHQRRSLWWADPKQARGRDTAIDGAGQRCDGVHQGRKAIWIPGVLAARAARADRGRPSEG